MLRRTRPCSGQFYLPKCSVSKKFKTSKSSKTRRKFGVRATANERTMLNALLYSALVCCVCVCMFVFVCIVSHEMSVRMINDMHGNRAGKLFDTHNFCTSR